MNELSKLNRPFVPDLILTATELNTVTDRIDEIISLIISLDPSAPSPTDLDLQNKFDNVKKELLEVLDKALKDLQEKMKVIDELPEGITRIEHDFDIEEFIKKTEKGIAWVTEFSRTYNQVTLGAYAEKLTAIDDWYTSIGSKITLTPTQIEMILGAFDENGDIVVKPAAIIASLTEKKEDGKTYLKSNIYMSADQVSIDSDEVNILGALNVLDGIKALRGYISNLTTTNTEIKGLLTALNATITGKADISDLTALNATINGKATIDQLDALTAVILGKATINSVETLSAQINTLRADILDAVDATIENLNVPTVALIKLAVIEDLTVVKSVKTGTTGYVAEVDTSDNYGYFRIYNSQNNLDTVRIQGWDLTLSIGVVSVGSSMTFQSQDFSLVNKTGWQMVFGAHGISMISYIKGKKSSIILTPDYLDSANHDTPITGALIMETSDANTSSPIYRQTVAGFYERDEKRVF